MKKLILASTSPRRKELLEKEGFIFDIMSPDFDESLVNRTFSYKKIENIARNKCESVAKKIKEPALIISADTVVIYENNVMGKPKNFDESFKMLSLLNGNTHKVVTAICIKDTEKNKIIIKSDTSEVTFNKKDENEIKDYINNFKPFDKAGSYGIQEMDKSFINGIKGEYDNIVGMPIKMLKKMLDEITNPTN